MKALFPLLTFLAVSYGPPPSRAEALSVCVTATAAAAPGATAALRAARDKAARTERRTAVTAGQDPARGKARLAGSAAIPPVDASDDTPEEEAPEEDTPEVTGARLVIARPAAAVRNDAPETAPGPPAVVEASTEAEAGAPAAGAVGSGGGGRAWSWERLTSLLLPPLVLALLLSPFAAWAALRRKHG